MELLEFDISIEFDMEPLEFVMPFVELLECRVPAR